MSARRINFPFLWGAATSAHQVEGNNTANDWWVWEQAGKVPEKSGLACDHYRRFQEDIELIERLGHNAHRFSIEWSRLEPAENQWNDEAFVHYERVLKELRSRNIEPIVTLHHFTNPQWFSEKGGWLHEDVIRYFVRYVRKAVRAYGRYVRFWITINEPLVYLYHSYYGGLWPPGHTSFQHSLKVFRDLLVAHVEAYRAIHRYYEYELASPAWVSAANHMSYFVPCHRTSFKDWWTVVLRRWFANYLFLDAATTGFLFYPGIFCEFLPAPKTLDFIGLNYYTRDFIHFAGWREGNSLGGICDKAHHPEDIQGLNVMGWDIYPEGLYYILKSLRHYRLPIMVTENGTCVKDDEKREGFIREHTDAVAKAIRKGVPVIGYLYWALLDNFEWAHGFGPRFGIIDVDYATQQRKIRPSAQVLRETCRKLRSQGG